MIQKGAITSIGSWPQTDYNKIVNLIIENFKDLPSWPQLPKLGFHENMYVQYSEGLPSIVIEEKEEKIYFDTSKEIFSSIQTVYENFLSENYNFFAISEKYAKGLYIFKQTLQQKAKLKFVKGQTLGPISLGLSLTDENKRLILYNDQMSDAIVKSCVCKAVWQAKFLSEIAEKVVIFIDEPYLVSYGSAYINITRDQVISMLNEIIDKLHELNVLTGVHCCGNTDWSLLTDTNVDIINFDAYEFFDGFMLYPDQINKFLGQNKYIAWGIIPTKEEKIFSETPESLFAKLKNQQQILAGKGVDINNLEKNAIITPSCGTGSLSESASEKAIELLVKVSGLYRQ
jgi:methionine synthase II (cobalamin-independent)